MQALIHSHVATAQHLPHHRSVKISTYGILFFGTPHQGGEGVAWGKRAARIASIYVNTNTRILHHLERDSEWLQRQLQEYASISNSFVTKFAYETYPTPIFAGGSLVVSRNLHSQNTGSSIFALSVFSIGVQRLLVNLS